MDDIDRRELIEEAEHLAPGLIHEMRQPLMGILGALEMLARRMPAMVASPEWRMLAEQASRLEELFRTYQTLFSGAAVASAPFAVDETVRRAVSLLGPRLRKLGDRFSLHAVEGPVLGLGTPPALVHAVTNLLVNALDAVEDQAKDGRVHVRVLPCAERIEVRVSDEGSGIPAEIRPLIFLPRFTTKPEGRGTGLGLHLARTVMLRSGGAVRLVDDSDPSRISWAHTEFAIDVPSAQGVAG